MAARNFDAADLVGVTTANSMLALDGSKKLYCVGCGGPRDVSYAETHPCGCCGSLGTQKTMPEFDEHGERIPDEVIAARRAAEREVRAAERAAKEAAEPKPETPKPAPKPKVVKQKTAPAKPAPKPKVVKAIPAAKPAPKQSAAAALGQMFRTARRAA